MAPEGPEAVCSWVKWWNTLAANCLFFFVEHAGTSIEAVDGATGIFSTLVALWLLWINQADFPSIAALGSTRVVHADKPVGAVETHHTVIVRRAR